MQYVTVAEAARIAGRSKVQIRNKILDGTIKARLPKGPTLILRSSLDEYIEAVESGVIAPGKRIKSENKPVRKRKLAKALPGGG